MTRRSLLAISLSAALAAAPLSAQTVEEKVTAQLKNQGFTHLSVTRTWLGRLRITASSKSQKREIVVDRTTGEVLRDYVEDIGDQTSASSTSDSEDSSTGNSGSSGNSGESGDDSGGGNSGSSGGDSGGGDSGGGNSGSGGGGNSGSGGDQAALHFDDFIYLTGGQTDNIGFGHTA